MSLSPEQVAKIAHLARIAVPEERLAPLGADLNRILAFVEQLQAVDTSGVVAMASPTPMAAPLREDQVTDGNIPDKVTGNAPEVLHNFYVVPKVVE